MIYSQVVYLENGVASVNIGGAAYRPEDPQSQLGYQVPPRNGVIWLAEAGESIAEVRASVSGYSPHEINDFSAPGHVIVELPAKLILRGPVDLPVYVQAWEIFATGADRGAKRTIQRSGENVTAGVPAWATTFDFSPLSDAALATFRDAAAAVTGIAYGRFAYHSFSVPARSVTVELSGADSHLTFRQQG